MNRDDLKQRIHRCIDESSDRIIDWAREVGANPELGFKERATAQLIGSVFRELSMPVREGIAMTGIEGRLDCARPGPVLLVMGEMDAVVNRDHPSAQAETGVAHLCGHHLQVAMMLAVALGLKKAEAAGQLSGRIQFLGTPAEEFIEIEERLRMRDDGLIRFLGGKQELVRLGYLDDVDLAMMVHSHPSMSGHRMLFGGTGNGFLAKSIRFRGKAAHAGVAPHAGVNALNAACLAVINMHVQRETFQDTDSVRVHSIITNGGDVVNVIPSDVRMETYVRGRSAQAIDDAAAKVDRALRAGGLAVGAEVTIRNIPGYLPLMQDELLSDVARRNAVAMGGTEAVGDAGFQGGSTDMGDVSHLMPVIHPYAGGVRGMLHGEDFQVDDFEDAVIFPAKVMAATAVDLLFGDAGTARHIVSRYRPVMSTDEYLKFLKRIGDEQCA